MGVHLNRADFKIPPLQIGGFVDFQEKSYAKKLSQNRVDPRYVVVSNMSQNPYDTVGISLILRCERNNFRVDVIFRDPLPHVLVRVFRSPVSKHAGAVGVVRLIKENPTFRSAMRSATTS